jgi:hypothetical protein
MGAASSHPSLEVLVAHEMLTARPQQLSPPQERSLGLPQSTALIAIPYAFCGFAQLKWRWRNEQRRHPGGLWRDLLVALVALVALIFSLAFIYWSPNSAERWYVIWARFPMAGAAGLVGVPVFLAGRGRTTALGGL